MDTIAIVGLSLAGLRAAETLRRLGFDGRVVAIGSETAEPYDRPPLSKEVLAGTRDAADIVLRRQGLDDLDLDLRLGVRATALDAAQRVLHLADGSEVAYDGLVIATGAAPRLLPAAVCPPDLAGVHPLRTLDDALAVRGALDASARVCVIGAGFIGAEVAAACRTRGLDVTVLEAQEQPMIRGLGAELGAVCAQLHRDHGVDLRLGVTVEAVEGNGRVERVRLGDGSVVECDVLVVGIGVVPDTAWLDGSGVTLGNGVECDETCLAAPGVVACGDVASWPNPLFGGERMRLEHWTNATEQAVHAAERLLTGVAKPFAPVPFVWSDQYDCKIQSVGRIDAGDDIEIVHGDLASRKFVALFGRGGRLRGALGFSQPRHVMQYRRMLSEQVSFADALAHARA
jgi:3-phenylpropionate/trans-cinnamate dioxygenase ferredoxin reductase subunit